MPWKGNPRETEKEEDQKHLKKRYIARGTEDRKDLGRNEDGCERQEEMECSSDRPMSPSGRSGLSQVSHICRICNISTLTQR